MSCGTCGITASETLQGDTGVPAGAPSNKPPPPAADGPPLVLTPTQAAVVATMRRFECLVGVFLPTQGWHMRAIYGPPCPPDTRIRPGTVTALRKRGLLQASHTDKAGTTWFTLTPAGDAIACRLAAESGVPGPKVALAAGQEDT